MSFAIKLDACVWKNARGCRDYHMKSDLSVISDSCVTF